MNRKVRIALTLLAVTLAALLPHALLADWSGTEGRRVQIALEMVRSGNWMVPTLFGEPTWAKPPLHYWLLGICARWFGTGWLSLRLPSIAMVWLLALLAFWLHKRVFKLGAAWTVALGVACAPLVVAEFASTEIDPPFACLTAASLWLLAFGVAREHGKALVLAGIVGGLALLEKGPPYAVFAAGAWLVWWRHRRCRGLLRYLVPLLLVPALYYVPLWLFVVPPDEFWGVANTETVGRMATYQWRHVLDIPAFWCRALLVQLPLVCWCFWEYRSRRDARMGPEDLVLRMCSGAAVTAVLLLTLFPGKPTRYLLPNVPLFTFAVAPAAAHYARRCPSVGAVGRAMVRALGLLGAAALLVLPFLSAPLPLRSALFALVAALTPRLVTTPRRLLAMCFWLPVLAGWTVLADYRDRWEGGPRARAPFGPMLAAELDLLGPDVRRDLHAFGHVPGGLLLGADLLPAGHEAAVRQPTARFVLREDDREPPLPDLPGYAERLRFCVPGEVLVVEERAGSGK